jgi:hypothetical protein
VEVGQLLAKLLAASLVDELIVGVFAETMGHRRCESGEAEMLEPRFESPHPGIPHLDPYTETRSKGVLP